MSANSVKDVQARVVAWHNRHPLACRITPEQVRHIGVVALPYVATDDLLKEIHPPAAAARQGTLRERAREPFLEPSPQHEQEPESVPGSVPESVPEPSSLSSPLVDGLAAPAAPATAATAVIAGLPSRSLWRRLCAMWSGAPRAFSEDFLPALSSRAIARFGLRYGSPHLPSDAAMPVRWVAADPALLPPDAAATHNRYVLSVAIEQGTRRHRILLGAAPGSALLGPRLWSQARVGTAGVVLMATSVLGVGLPLDLWPTKWSEPSIAKESAQPLQAVSSSTAGSAPTLAAAPTPQPMAEPVVAVAVPASAPQVAMQILAPALNKVVPTPNAAKVAWPVNIRPHLDGEEARAARQIASDARSLTAAASGGAVFVGGSAGGSAGGTSGAPATVDTSAVAGAPSTTRFALVARTTRTRVASEVMLGLMKSVAAGYLGGQPGGQPGGQQTEVVAARAGWRATWWPFTSRQQAQQALAALVTVGLEAELVEF